MLILSLLFAANPAQACRPAPAMTQWTAPANGATDVPVNSNLVLGLSGFADSGTVNVALTEGRTAVLLPTPTIVAATSDDFTPGETYFHFDPADLSPSTTYTLTIQHTNGNADVVASFTTGTEVAPAADHPVTSLQLVADTTTRSDTCGTGTFRSFTACGNADTPTGGELLHLYRVTDENSALDDLLRTQPTVAGESGTSANAYVAWDIEHADCVRMVLESASGELSDPSNVVCPDIDTVDTACPIADVDGDGSLTADDCNDDDATIYPGATEVPYDDIDQDCDGDDLIDADDDGFDAIGSGGTDCDDTDADVNTDAEEIEDDGIDQDCDGVDATSDTGGDTDTDADTGDVPGDNGGCGCSSNPAPATGLLLTMLPLLARRRRA